MWLAWAVPFAVYASSLNGGVGYWDTGEAQTVPWIFGIMHPTGFPAYTVIGGFFAHAFAFGAVSWRMALFSALCTSGAAWLIARIVVELDGHPWIAAACAWVYAFGNIAWVRGTRAEVHTLALFFAMSALYFAIRWYRRGDARALVAGALAWGLAMATHPLTAFLLPAFLVLFAVRVRTTPPRAVALAFAALLCGLALYAYLPIRSSMVTAQSLDPTRSLGLPPGRAFWDNNHPATWNGFRTEVTGAEFPTRGALASMLDPHNYTAQGPSFCVLVLQQLTPLCVLFALGGLAVMVRRDRWLAPALVLAFVFPVAFAFAFSIEADKERYYLISLAVLMVLCGYGAGALARALPPMRRAAAAALALMAVVLLGVNRETFQQARNLGAQPMIAAIVAKTPPNAILIAPWLDATPLAYAAYVERSLGDRIVDCAWLADNADMVPQWALRRPVYVVGELFGQVPGYTAVQVSKAPDLWKLQRNVQK